jgi:hypothetical protein
MARRRLWLLFFREGTSVPWWRRGLKRGFRHVTAAAFYAAEGRWIVFDPSSCGTAIEVYSPDEFDRVLCALAPSNTAILRFPSDHVRRFAPLTGWCVDRSRDCSGFDAPL